MLSPWRCIARSSRYSASRLHGATLHCAHGSRLACSPRMAPKHSRRPRRAHAQQVEFLPARMGHRRTRHPARQRALTSCSPRQSVIRIRSRSSPSGRSPTSARPSTAIPQPSACFNRVVLMGGSIHCGYGNPRATPPPPPEPEYNIAMDPGAARKLLASGVPIFMMPLDSTQWKLDDSKLAHVAGSQHASDGCPPGAHHRMAARHSPAHAHALRRDGRHLCPAPRNLPYHAAPPSGRRQGIHPRGGRPGQRARLPQGKWRCVLRTAASPLVSTDLS